MQHKITLTDWDSFVDGRAHRIQTASFVSSQHDKCSSMEENTNVEREYDNEWEGERVLIVSLIG